MVPEDRDSDYVMTARPFGWTLSGAGWAVVAVRLSAQQAALEMNASYFHDSLRDTATAILALDNGAKEARIVLMDEPGEHHIIVRRVDHQSLDIEVRWYEEWRSWGVGSEAFVNVASGRVRWKTFRGAVISALQDLLREHGVEGYRSEWVKHDFPADELRRLEVGVG
ncbi:MAG: hypothetical protein M3680_09605 [Myxococcota bacterium]|nr:hypothetical protein [Myxococcota bacterium]